MKKYFNYSLWVLFLIQFGIAGCDKKDADTEPAPPMVFTGILKNIQTAHPRLLLSKERLDELKTLSLTDSRLKKYASDVIAQADKDIFKQPLQHVLIGPRLLDISRECLLRVYNLAFAYRWTGNPKYLSSAVANLRNVCSFSDWNPSHFLDVAEMTHAVAIGYDWLYDDMDETERKAIKDGLIKLGLNEGKKAYAANAWWMKVDHNWNQVCNSGY
ncbi:MAG: hypothetical protein HC830_02475 [Bacteroidetes bacterium]|nr:hypothetical protein [Bacteroidota bacterium]